MTTEKELFITFHNNKVILNDEHPLHDKAQDIIRDIAHFNSSILPNDDIYRLCEDLYSRLLDVVNEGSSDESEVNEAVDNALMYTSVVNATFCAIINYVEDVETSLTFGEYDNFDNYKNNVIGCYANSIATAFCEMIQEYQDLLDTESDEKS